MKKPKVLFIDMDDTLADFGGHGIFNKLGYVEEVHMYEFGFFKNLKPIDGALVAVRALIKMGFDVQILTQPVAQSPHSYSEKAQWLAMWFPELVTKMNMVQDKGIAKGHYLIDDNPGKWKDKFEANGGKFITFQYNRTNAPTQLSNAEVWERILNYFAAESPFEEETND
jgi:5'(3')-deoxyribonucleotidase